MAMQRGNTAAIKGTIKASYDDYGDIYMFVMHSLVSICRDMHVFTGGCATSAFSA